MENGRIAAVGSADGSTTIVQFSDGLVDMQLNEKQALTSVSYSPCTGCALNMRQNPRQARIVVVALCTCTMLSSCDNHLDAYRSQIGPRVLLFLGPYQKQFECVVM